MHKPWFATPTRWIAGVSTLLLATACSSVKDPEPEPTTPDFVVRESLHVAERVSARSLADMKPMDSPEGRRFYLFTALCCDQFNKLYDADGRYVCAPSGGFTGQGDGRCPAWVSRRLWAQPTDLPGSSPSRVAGNQ